MSVQPDKFGRDGEYLVIDGKRYLLIYQKDVADCTANGCVRDNAADCAATSCNASADLSTRPGEPQ